MQADPGGDLPHRYVLTGPVEGAPYLGYCLPEVRQEAFSAVLEGVETGAYDTQDILDPAAVLASFGTTAPCSDP